jgi:hypothetical protein
MEYKIETKKGTTESETKYLTWVRQSKGKGIILLVESMKKPYVLNDSLLVEQIEGTTAMLNFSLFYGDVVVDATEE